MTSPPPALRLSCAEALCPLQEVPAHGPAPGVRGTPSPRDPKTSPQVQRVVSEGGAGSQTPNSVKGELSWWLARPSEGGDRWKLYHHHRNYYVLLFLSPQGLQPEVCRACLFAKGAAWGRRLEGELFPKGYLQPRQGVWAAWMHRTQPRSR